MNDDRQGNARDVPWRQPGIGSAVLSKTCGNCLKPKPTMGGQVRRVRGLVKKSFCCSQCCERMDARQGVTT